MMSAVLVFAMAFWTNMMTRAQITEDVLRCSPGYYMASLKTNRQDSCLPCSRCLPGYYQLVSCSSTNDTVCSACPNGTYSDRLSNLAWCYPCRRRCGNHQLSEPCTTKKDTVCKSQCEHGYYFDQMVSNCKRCSFCPPRSSERVYECTQHAGLSESYQCREGAAYGASRNREPRPQSFHGYANAPASDQVNGGTGSRHIETLEASPTLQTEGDMRYSDTAATVASMTTVAKIIEQTTGQPFPRQNEDRDLPVDAAGLFSSQRSKAMTATASIAMATAMASTPGNGMPSPSNRHWRPLSSNDIVIIVGCVLASGLISFVTTSVTCHFLMKKGIVSSKNATVDYARGRAPVQGWLIQGSQQVTEASVSRRSSVVSLI